MARLKNDFGRAIVAVVLLSALSAFFAGGVLTAVTAPEPSRSSERLDESHEPLPAATRVTEITRAYGTLPFLFESQPRRPDRPHTFLARGRGFAVAIAADHAMLAFGERVVRMRLAGANAAARLRGEHPLETKVNYLIGSDPDQWRTGIATYGQVVVAEIYAGVDLVYYGSQGRLEYDFIVRPGANPEVIGLTFHGVDRPQVDAAGDVVLRATHGQIRLRKPVIYQDIGGRRRPIQGRFKVSRRGTVGFAIGDYDPAHALIIDPVLEYSTYLGGSAEEEGRGIAVDAFGDAYVTGFTKSATFLTAAPGVILNPPAGSGDVFVAKLNAAGTALTYLTYVGGGANDEGSAIAVGADGSAYVAGKTESSDFPGVNGWQADKVSTDAFAFRLNATGSALLYSTYIGSNGLDDASGIAVDDESSAYVAGNTDGTLFVTTPGAYKETGFKEAFVVKLGASGDPVYSTLLGGSGNGIDTAHAIAVDAEHNAYVAGNTNAVDNPNTLADEGFPIVNGFQPAKGGNNAVSDAFLAKLSASGEDLLYSTYFGGSAAENSQPFDGGLALGGLGEVYLTGSTPSGGLATPGAFQVAITNDNFSDAFVVKIDTLQVGAASRIYSTYLGGTGQDNAFAIAVDPSGSAYVTGSTASAVFPATSCGVHGNKGGVDAFVARLNPAGSALFYSTYLGGDAIDAAYGIVVDASGHAYVTGKTQSRDIAGTLNDEGFPTTPGAIQPAKASDDIVSDAFAAKLATSACLVDLAVRKTDAPDPIVAGAQLTYQVGVFNNLPPDGIPGATATNVQLVDTLPPGVNLVSATADQGTGCPGDPEITCSLGDIPSGSQALVTIIVVPTVPGTITNSATASATETDVDPTNNTRSVDTTVSAGSADLVITKADSADPIIAGNDLTYTITITNNNQLDAATGVTVQDNLPASVSFQSASAGCTGEGPVLCTVGTIAAGANASVQIVVKPQSGGQISNTAFVSSLTFDPEGANNVAVEPTTVTAAADLAIEKTASLNPLNVGWVTYTLTATNNGPSFATNVIVTDVLPAGVALISAIGCTGSGPVTCAVGNLAWGASATRTIVVVTSNAGPLVNTASVVRDQFDPVAANDSFTLNTIVPPSADMSITKTDSSDPVSVGGILTYAITAFNNGPTTATNVKVTDTLLANVSFAFADPNCTGTVDVTCALGTIPAGSSRLIKITVIVNAGPVTNTASVAADEPDPVPGNNSAVQTTAVLSQQQQMQMMMAQVQSLVRSGVLNRGQGTSLVAQLGAAIAAFDRGNDRAARNSLEAFIEHVRAFVRSGRLSEVEARPLLEGATALVRTLSNPRRATR